MLMNTGLAGLIEKMEEHVGPGAMRVLFFALYGFFLLHIFGLSIFVLRMIFDMQASADPVKQVLGVVLYLCCLALVNWGGYKVLVYHVDKKGKEILGKKGKEMLDKNQDLLAKNQDLLAKDKEMRQDAKRMLTEINEKVELVQGWMEILRKGKHK